MDWVACLGKALEYMDNHLTEEIAPADVAAHVHMSSVYLQRGFQIATGYSVSEYLRNRRLYLAALEIRDSKCKVIDVALKYGYETPESFAKAFSRFHGMPPSEVRNNPSAVRIFHPLHISIVVKGGDTMDYTVDAMPGFQVIGFCREFEPDGSAEEIPAFWDEIFRLYARPLQSGQPPRTPLEEAVHRYRIGEFGVCMDGMSQDGRFCYMIAGAYSGGAVPEGLRVYDIPAATWAKFRCCGPMPGALQSVNAQIFSEWLPGNPEYEIAGNCNIEWYSPSGSTQDLDYQSAVWIPVREK